MLLSVLPRIFFFMVMSHPGDQQSQAAAGTLQSFFDFRCILHGFCLSCMFLVLCEIYESVKQLLILHVFV